MVRSLKALIIAASIMMSVASAFAPILITSASTGMQSRPLSPSLLQASATVLDAPSTGKGVILDRPSIIERKEEDKYGQSTNRDMDPDHDCILRIYNDKTNTREYIAVCLVQVVGLCESRAYFTMQDAHQNGIAKVGEYNQEVAECYEDLLHEKGILCDVVSSNGE